MKRTRSQLAQEAHQRQLELGWRRLSLRLPPEAADALALILAHNEGATAVAVVGELLIAKARKLPARRAH